MAGGSRTLEVRFVGDDAQLKKTLGSVARSSQATEGHVRKLHAGLALAAGGFIALEAARKAVDFLKEAAHAAIEDENAMTRSGVAVKNAGESWKRLKDPIDKSLAAMSNSSGFMKADLANAFSKLELATGNHTKALRLENDAMNISAQTGKPLAVIALALGKAYDGSAGALKRLGIITPNVTTAQDRLKQVHDRLIASGAKLNANQKEAYKTALDAAKATDKQATSTLALDTVHKKFAGAVAARSETMAGKVAIFQAQWENTKVRIGEAILPALTSGMGLLVRAMDFLGSNKSFANLLSEVTQGAKDFAEGLKSVVIWAKNNTDTMKVLGVAAAAVFAVLATAGVIEGAVAAFTALRSILITTTAAQEGLDAAMTANPLGIVVVAVAALSVGLYELYQHSATARAAMQAAFADIRVAAAASLGWIKDTLVPAFRTQWDSLAPKVQAVVGAIGTAVGSIVSTIRSHWDEIKKIVAPIITTEFNVAKTIITAWVREIENVINLFSGVLHGDWSKAWSALKALVETPLNAAKSVVVQIVTGIGPLAEKAALGVAHAIANGIKKAPGFLEGLAGDLINKISSVVVQVATDSYNLALSIGGRIADGVVSGAGGLASKLKNKLTSAISGAVSAAGGLLHGSGPFQFTIHEIGEPMVNGILQGIANRAPSIRGQLLQGILTAVSDAKSAAMSAAGDLGSTIGNAISAQAAKAISALDNSPLGQQLAALNDQITARQKAQQLDSLNQGLATAQASGDPQQIQQAQRALDDWSLQQQQQTLQSQLQQQRDTIQKEADAKSTAVQTGLINLQDSFNRGLIKQDEYNRGVKQLLADSGQDYATIGSSLGSFFANGFRDALSSLAGDVSTIVSAPAAIAYAKKLTSVGSMLGAVGGGGKGFHGFATGGIVKGGRGGILGMIGEGKRDELITPLDSRAGRAAIGNGGGDTYNVTVNTVTADAGLGDVVIQALVTAKRRGNANLSLAL